MIEASISIIICTRNRAEHLRKTLLKIGQCKVPENYSAELLVVDNDSQDHTRQVIEQTKLVNLPLRYVLEPKKGLAHARNCGILESKGNIILFTDDDVRPGQFWIEAMCEPIHRGEVEVTQGRVNCRFEQDFPKWYDYAVFGGFAEVNWSESSLLLSSYELTGANMAFSRSCLLSIGLFNTLLGAGRSGFFEDTEFSWRLVKKGYTLKYCPDGEVVHLPSVSRLSRKSLRREWFQHGVSSIIAMGYHTDRKEGPPDMSLPRRILRNIKLATKRVLMRQENKASQDEMFLYMHLGSAWARLMGLRRIAHKLGEPLQQPPKFVG